MKQLSIIIVSYNVKYFLEHCLLSVQRACASINADLWVVDNDSTDGSVEMVRSKFPSVNLIANTQNVGFSKANNQAAELAQGKYILYLNPDTIVPEDCFSKTITYMEEHEHVGALGCRLIDGRGQFLPESKRGFPSASVAFFKISGLSSLFPTSKLFNRYHLGFLPEHEIADVDILVGCFMLCRNEVIKKVGGFDEEYFMYGEDIDLSYKIRKAGYKNVYFPLTTVIHYKGESTKKGSMNYVKMFYQAMIVFAKKHFQKSQKSLFVFLIKIAIYIRALLAFFARIFSLVKLPLLDAALILSSIVTTKWLWVHNVKVSAQYPSALLTGFFLLYTLIWIGSVYINGGYDTPYKAARLLRGMLIGGIITLALYGLLNEDMRFSRGITVLGALMSTLLMLGARNVLQLLGVKSVAPAQHHTHVLLVGTDEEENRVRTLLHQAYIKKNIIGCITPLEVKEEHQIGVLSQLPYLIKPYRVGEIIFVQGQATFAQIIEYMQRCGASLSYKLHGMGADSIIGSDSKNTAGDLYTTEIVYNIARNSSKRNKRMVDIIVSILMLLLSPCLVWFARKRSSFIPNLFYVLEGDKTFVGYTHPQFPKLKPNLLSAYVPVKDWHLPDDNKEHLEWLYAKNYTAWDDVRLIWKQWRNV